MPAHCVNVTVRGYYDLLGTDSLLHLFLPDWGQDLFPLENSYNKIISDNEYKIKDFQNQLSDSKYKIKELERK